MASDGTEVGKGSKPSTQGVGEKPDYGRFTILVVDDEEDLRNAIIFDLKRKGFHVFSAESGSKALGLIKANNIDLVISDVRMADGDGMFLLGQIQALGKKVPLIFITGFTDYSERECLERGALRVIAKPFDRKLLLEFIIEALQSM